ncbi:hypothetical protein [Roseobacter weihaiensis]|nr:hypothetical protein [Roseobacter sp. H9]
MTIEHDALGALGVSAVMTWRMVLRGGALGLVVHLVEAFTPRRI